MPLAAWLLGKHLDYAGRVVVLRAMLLLALASAALGLVQLTMGAGSPVYFYHVTNDDSSVGFFSNANHLALFLAGAIVIALAWLADAMTVRGRIPAPAAVACGLAIGVLLFGIAGTSSRAGAIFSVVGLLGGLAMLPLERRIVSTLTISPDPAVRAEVEGWVERSLDGMPDGLRLGVLLESWLFTMWAKVARPGDLHGLLAWLERSPMGLLQAYPRLFRSLVRFGELELEPVTPR